MDKEDEIRINIPVSLSQYCAIKNFVHNKQDENNMDIIKTFLTNVFEKTFNKASYLELLGNKFVDI